MSEALRTQNRGRSGNGSSPRLHVHLAVLGAAVQRRDHLAGIQQFLGVEGALERQHLLAFGRSELHAHRRQLLDADAVLAGDGAAERDAGLEDVGAEQFAAVQLVGIVGIEQDQRVQVAVAGMEDVAAAQPVLDFSISAMRIRMSASLLRGIVESMHM